MLPKCSITTTNEITSLVLEHGILTRDMNQLIIALALFITNVGKVWISQFTMFADGAWFIVLNDMFIPCPCSSFFYTTHLVLLEEWFRVVVGINVNLGQGIVDFLVSGSFSCTHIEPWQKKLESITLLHFIT